MKLRIRSLETKQTLKIEVPSSSCTLEQLKHLISQAFPSSASSVSDSDSIHLSLNRKDEVYQNSEEDTLQSIGITSGDLVYFTRNPNVFSISTDAILPKLDTQIGHKVENMNTHIVQEAKMVENLDTQSVQEAELMKNMDTQIAQKVEKMDTQIVREAEKVENLDTLIGQEAEKLKNLDPQIVQEAELMKNMDSQIAQKVENMDTQMYEEAEKVEKMDPQIVQKVEKMDTQIVQEAEKVNNLDTQMDEEAGLVKEMDTQMDEEAEMVKKMDTQMEEEAEGGKKLEPHEAKTRNLVPEGEGKEEFMEVDENGDYSDVNFTKSLSVPGFLRKVFTEELNDDGGRDHKLLVVAVHAVFVESGFVLVDPFTFTEVSGCQFLKCWPSGGSRMRLFYTLPEAIDHIKRGDCNVIDTVELKFQSLGKFFIANGSLSGGGSVSTHRVTLNEDQLVPFLNVVWANCGLNEDVDGGFGEREVFVFWRNVKDGLVLPLLIDLCDKSGLVLPPCFTRLPTDLKLKILESLPGVEIAKASCLSSELRYLGSSDDLWKKKYAEQFGDGEISGEGGHWKEKFVKSWECRKRRKVINIRRVVNPLRFVGGPHPFPGPWMPHIIGGDYDLFPPPFDNTGNPFGRAPPSRLLHPRSNHVRRCHLGGHRSNFT
ncbi:F-box protein SKIP22 [Capsicum galapagoense]